MTNQTVINVSNIDKLQEQEKYLLIENALAELCKSANLQDAARQNLRVYSADQIEEILNGLREDDNKLRDDVNDDITSLSEQLNLHSNAIESIEDKFNDYVTKGNATFTNTPTVNDEPLVKKSEVESKLEDYAEKTEVNNLKTELSSTQESITNLVNNVWTTDESYSANQIDRKLNDYVLKNENYYATQSFVKSQTNKAIKSHLDAVDPHGMQSKLETALKKYAKANDVYKIKDTYNRRQIDEIIEDLVEKQLEEPIQHHKNTVVHLNSQDVRNIVSDINYLVKKKDLTELQESLIDKVESNQPIWKTSGPVLTTVGFIEDNTELPEQMTLQKVLDSIFYGNIINISANEPVKIGDKVELTICIRMGITAHSIKLYREENGTEIEIGEFDQSEFDDGCIVVTPKDPITGETKFTLKVEYGEEQDQESVLIKPVYPLFVGILPKTMDSYQITMGYLKELVNSDPVNNAFKDSLPIVHNYNFVGAHKLIVGIPSHYTMALYNMSNSIQSFKIDAFSIHHIDLTLEGVGLVKYDFYKYEQPLSKLDSKVTFNFEDVEVLNHLKR